MVLLGYHVLQWDTIELVYQRNHYPKNYEVYKISQDQDEISHRCLASEQKTYHVCMQTIELQFETNH